MSGPQIAKARAEAIASGSKFYMGNPCKHGHSGERSVKYHHCRECSNARTREYWKNRDYGCREDSRHWSRVDAAKRLGYTPPPHENDCRVYPLDGLCEVCRRPEGNGRRLSLEHDHATGAFRGWTCHHCNMLIGKFEKYGLEFLVAFIKGEFGNKAPPIREIAPSLSSFKKRPASSRLR